MADETPGLLHKALGEAMAASALSSTMLFELALACRLTREHVGELIDLAALQVDELRASMPPEALPAVDYARARLQRVMRRLGPLDGSTPPETLPETP